MHWMQFRQPDLTERDARDVVRIRTVDPPGK
jgi:hypothetical protein